VKAFPTNIQFRPVRAQLTAYRQIYNVIQLVVYVTIFGLIAAIINTTVDTGAWQFALYLPAIVFGLYYLVGIILTPFQVRIHGWSEQADDIIVRSGAIFRSYRAVPYGRLQFVVLRQGPLQRTFDLADLTITTAGSTATITGLPTAEATRLRDDLSARGFARLAGL